MKLTPCSKFLFQAMVAVSMQEDVNQVCVCLVLGFCFGSNESIVVALNINFKM